MASAATSTRSGVPAGAGDGRARPAVAVGWRGWALAAVCVLALACFFAFQTYPTYDSLYALLWGRELLHGQLPDLQVYRAPTEHPLALLYGMLCSLFGRAGARLVVLGAVVSFVGLVAGIYRLSRLCFGPVVALLAALLMLSRLFVENLALQGYLDVTYIALIVWAAALEAERRRRGWPVLSMLCAAGLLRPEAWLLSGAYWLWLAWSRPRRPPRDRIGLLALAALAPALWVALDTALTGDPLHSLRSTAGLARQLGRAQDLSGVLSSTWTYAVRIDKLPVVLGAIPGALLALELVPRRATLPLALLACLLAAFVIEGAAGASALDRYMVAASTAIVPFCAVALGGWSLLERGSHARGAWMVAAGALVLLGIAQAGSKVTFAGLRDTLAYHEELDSGLSATLRSRAVRAAIDRCKAVSLPNNKLIPDVRWMLGDPHELEIFARGQAREQAAAGSPTLAARPRAGSVAVYPRPVTHFFDAVAGVGEGPLATRPQVGFRPIYESRTYAVYANC